MTKSWLFLGVFVAICPLACGAHCPPAESPEVALPVPDSASTEVSPRATYPVKVERAEETPENHRAVVAEMLELLDMETALNTSRDVAIDAQLSANPALAQYEDIMRGFFAKHMSWESLREDFVQMYMETFTQGELEEIVAFYHTSTGKKAIRMLPELMTAGAAIGQERVQKHLPELQEMVRKRMLENSKK